ncbi:hypothetical protein HDK77DRAFT_435590 [Phyllosticta capitalensis]
MTFLGRLWTMPSLSTWGSWPSCRGRQVCVVRVPFPSEINVRRTDCVREMQMPVQARRAPPVTEPSEWEGRGGGRTGLT